MSALLILLSCGSFGLSPHGDSAQTTSATSSTTETSSLDPLRIDDVAPSWAPLAGGTAVTVTGAGFEGDVAFWFGGAEVDVTVLSDEELAVTTPAVAVEGTVDLLLSSDLGEVVLEDGFTFTDEAPTTTTSGGSGSGLVTRVVEFDYLAVGCPNCFSPALDQYIVSAVAMMHPPVSGSWNDNLPAQGSCTDQPDTALLTNATDDVGAFMYLQSGAQSLDLRRSTIDGTVMYMSGPLGSGDYTRNAAYDLAIPDLGVTISDAVATTSGFKTFTPLEILYYDNQAWTSISANAFRFTWAPTDIAESVVVQLEVYAAGGNNALLGQVVCVSEDNGSLTVPSNLLSSFGSGALVVIYFYRWETRQTELDGDIIEGMSMFGLLGTATLR